MYRVTNLWADLEATRGLPLDMVSRTGWVRLLALTLICLLLRWVLMVLSSFLARRVRAKFSLIRAEALLIEMILATYPWEIRLLTTSIDTFVVAKRAALKT